MAEVKFELIVTDLEDGEEERVIYDHLNHVPCLQGVNWEEEPFVSLELVLDSVVITVRKIMETEEGHEDRV